MSGTLREQKEMRIAEEAAEWLGVLQHAGQNECEAFAKWLTDSRRHVEEFLLATAVERVLDRIDSQRRVNVEEILARAAANVVPLEPGTELLAPKRERGVKGRWAMHWAVAAGVAAATTAVWLFVQPVGVQSYRTAVGKQRSVELPDGSYLYLNTHSQARVHYTPEGRNVELVSGEALFDVRRDTARPFRVRSGDTVIQALGTQFNVYRRDQSITVAVIEGAIRVSTRHESSKLVAAPESNAGEEARVARNGRITQHRPVEVMRVAAWRQRRLMFRADTLEDIAAEFNRYNDAPQIQVEGEEARARRFTGVFNADDPRSLVQFLGSYSDLTFEEQGDKLIIRAR